MLSSCNSRTLLSHALLMLWSPIAARSSPKHSVPAVTALTQALSQSARAMTEAECVDHDLTNCPDYAKTGMCISDTTVAQTCCATCKNELLLPCDGICPTLSTLAGYRGQLLACARGASVECCSGLDTMFGPASEYANCACDSTSDTALKGIKQQFGLDMAARLLSCQADHDLRVPFNDARSPIACPTTQMSACPKPNATDAATTAIPKGEDDDHSHHSDDNKDADEKEEEDNDDDDSSGSVAGSSTNANCFLLTMLVTAILVAHTE